MKTYKPATTLILLLFVLLSSCEPDNDPASDCSDAGVFVLSASAQVIKGAPVENSENGNRYWVCAGGELTLAGSANTILVEEGGKLTLNGHENTAYNLGAGELIINGDKNTGWLNGESKTTVNGTKNFLHFYKIGILLEYGTQTSIEDLCGNVEVDYTKAPEGGCR